MHGCEDESESVGGVRLKGSALSTEPHFPFSAYHS